jgi:hypothetical protein
MASDPREIKSLIAALDQELRDLVHEIERAADRTDDAEVERLDARHAAAETEHDALHMEAAALYAATIAGVLRRAAEAGFRQDEVAPGVPHPRSMRGDARPGSSVYITLESIDSQGYETTVEVRVSDHAQPAGGGFSLDRGEQHGEADLCVDAYQPNWEAVESYFASRCQ